MSKSLLTAKCILSQILGNIEEPDPLPDNVPQLVRQNYGQQSYQMLYDKLVALKAHLDLYGADVVIAAFEEVLDGFLTDPPLASPVLSVGAVQDYMDRVKRLHPDSLPTFKIHTYL